MKKKLIATGAAIGALALPALAMVPAAQAAPPTSKPDIPRYTYTVTGDISGGGPLRDTYDSTRDQYTSTGPVGGMATFKYKLADGSQEFVKAEQAHWWFTGGTAHIQYTAFKVMSDPAHLVTEQPTIDYVWHNDGIAQPYVLHLPDGGVLSGTITVIAAD